MSFRGVVAFFLLAASVAGQSTAGSTMQSVRVRVALPTSDCASPIQVRLMGVNGVNAEASTNERCEVKFTNIPAGSHQLSAAGQNLSSNNATITVSYRSTAFADLGMRVERMDNSSAVNGPAAASMVSAADLAVPSRAQKKFDKAHEFSERHDYKKTIQTLKEAIAIYPAYAAAYNNLGVAYAHLGDRDQERDALQRAIGINDHFAQAHANLARMDIAASDFAGAEREFSKAAACNPTDAGTLSLLTYAEFMNHYFDLALATSRRAHGLAAPHAYAHQVAAQIYEQMGDEAEAIAELKLFLKEDPANERADMVRRELARVQAVVQAAAQPIVGRIH